MNELRKCLSTCLFATAALLGGASPAVAADAPPQAPQATAPDVAARSAALAKAAAMLTGALNPAQSLCNQGVGNGPDDEDGWGCDPANSNHASGSNDENGGEPGNPGRKGGNK